MAILCSAYYNLVEALSSQIYKATLEHTVPSNMPSSQQQAQRLFRASQLCHGLCLSLETVGTYEFYSSSWKVTNDQDIECINDMIRIHANEKNVDSFTLTKVCERFFPKFASSYRGQKLVLNTKHSKVERTGRGHPMTIEFTKLCKPDNKELETNISHTQIAGSSIAFKPNHFTKCESPSPMPDDKCMATTYFNHDMVCKSLNCADQALCKNAYQQETQTTNTSIFHMDRCTSSVELLSQNLLKRCVSAETIQLYDNKESFRITFEFSAGLCVLRKNDNSQAEVLIIRRVDDNFYELPKGHLEHGETLQMAAERELREETGLLNHVSIRHPLLSEIYAVKTENCQIEKSVHYFQAEIDSFLGEAEFEKLQLRDESSNVEGKSKFGIGRSSHIPWFGQIESQTCEVRWVTLSEARKLHWKSNTISHAVAAVLSHHSRS